MVLRRLLRGGSNTRYTANIRKSFFPLASIQSPKAAICPAASSFVLPRTMATSSATAASGTRAKVLDRTKLTPCHMAICQFPVGENKQENLKTAREYIQRAVKEKNAQVVVLPEIWNGPYAASEFPKFAEHVPANPEEECDESSSPSVKLLVDAAKEHQIYVIGGSIAERDSDGKIYNCSLTFGPTGELLARHRKLHLFDIDIPGKITFKESETLTAGNSHTLFTTPYGKFAVAICYDMRFPQLASMLRQEGADYIIYPGAFNLTTGPLHWELLLRARALDNQCYVAGASQARNPDASYQAWGHSSIVNPWGKVEVTTEQEPNIICAELNTARVDEVREQIPVSYQLRTDVYSLNEPRKTPE
eukprot:gb/GECG01002043.1/.p1 GENE.gb/GECG01002043.1/~~gb/GECG01002043.1/.p1  ORF type:complete len:362 (+),score=29.95 gb/GECG01002043.1/:1-1086(+)